MSFETIEIYTETSSAWVERAANTSTTLLIGKGNLSTAIELLGKEEVLPKEYLHRA
jgi:hypothetical protein